MNRIYRLVWNRSLAAVQVTSELARAPGSRAGKVIARSPRRRPLALAIAALALASVTAPVWSQTCTPADPSGCGAPGGIGFRQTRSPNGGAGNGTGGDATIWITNTSEGPGSVGSAGNGGAGSNGIFNPDSSINVTANGGAGGAVGATDNVSSSVTGGVGGAGEAAAAANSQSLVGGGGGGGGAGAYLNQANVASTVGTTTIITGGAGGKGGDALSSPANGYANNGDPGGGGGGGAGVLVGAGASNATLTIVGTVPLGTGSRVFGGAGGAGGNGGYAGSGGGGGDGVLVLGSGVTIVNNADRITGGAGGSPGTHQNGGNEPGGYGGGGAGVNLVGAGSSLQNLAGQIAGGGAGVSPLPNTQDQDGTPGVGVRAWGGASVLNIGLIAGGSNGKVQADSVLFSGGGNQLEVQSGAQFTGNIQSISGTTNGGDTLTLAGSVSAFFDASRLFGFATNIKTDSATWTLLNNGNAGINWTIQQGQLTGSANAFAGNLIFSSNGIGTPAVDFNQTTNGTYNGTITGTGNLIKDGSAALTFGAGSDLSSLVGTFAVNGGSVILQNLGNLQGVEVVGSAPFTFDISGTVPPTAMVAGISGPAGSSIVLGSHTLDLMHPANDTFSGVISGSGGLTLVTGTETLGGANTYTGDTNVGVSATLNMASGGRLGVNGASATRLDLEGTLNAGAMGAGSTLTISSLNGGGALTLGSVLLDITNASPADDFSGGISGGTAALTLDGGTQTLSGYNVYTGDTTINNGATLKLTGGAQIGNGLSRLNIANGTVDASTLNPGSTLAVFSLAGTGNLLMGSSELDIKMASDTYSGVISGSGGLTLDSGSETFSGANSYSGQTTFNGGTLTLTGSGQLGNGNSRVVFNTSTATIDATGMTSHLRVGSLAGGGTVDLGTNVVDIGDANDVFSGTINGTGLILEDGSQTLSGNNTLQNAVIHNGILAVDGNGQLGDANVLISQGTLDISGKTAGSVLDIKDLSGNSTTSVVLGQAGLGLSNALNAFNGVISGEGTVAVNGGTETLNGINTYTGVTSVTSSARLIIGDSAHTGAVVAGDVSVDAGTIGGYGTVQGSVTLIDGATLTPGTAAGVGTFTVNGDLNINDGSQLNFDFGAPGPNFATPGQSDHVVVGGSLKIGSSTLNVNNVGSMGPGLYNLFTWGDTLTISGGGFAPPPGMSLQILSVDKQINLIDTQNLTLNEWDADGLAGPGSMGGGSGTWSISSNTWSDTTGQFVGPMSPQPGFAIFGGAAGTVTVDDSNGNVGALGMQFVSDGYHLTGDMITLVGQSGAAPVLRVSSGDTAIIDNLLNGTDGINKTDGGTLVLNGSNLYTGTTTLSGGYLSVSSDANLGNAANALDFEGGTLEITGTGFNQTARNITWGAPGGGFDIVDAANTFTVAQALTGSGGLLKSGDGTLVLAGANTYGGGTVIDAGTLQGDSSSLQGDIADNATLAFAQATDGVFAGAISGSGQMIKTGVGTLTLSGANTYTGGTTISAGTLQGDTTSLQGNIIDNAALVFDQAGNGSFSGAISGSGSFTKNGAGVLALTGTNTYTGGTTISAGTLQGDTNSLQGNITDNAALVFNQASDGTYAGVVSGSGSFTKTGAGVLSLTGANTYSGGTTISAGTLQGDTTSLQGNITDNATLVFNQASDAAFSGVISGSGSFTKTGAGVLSLTGANTYAGGTTISAGTLQGNTTSLQGNIADNAALVFNQASDAAFSGVISGSGSLTKTGAGTLALVGVNTYSGGTTISAGALQGDTNSLQGSIVDNASLVFDQGIDGSFASAISGSGSLTKSGAGLLVLNGVNTYTGATTVNAGTLEIGDAGTPSASISSNVTVNSGGTLRGHGSINGNVTNDGIVWAGGSVGTLSINGNYTQNADGTLRLDVTPTQASQLKVSGQAMLGGTLDLIFAPGTYGTSNYALVQAGSLSGTFANVTGTVPGALPSQIVYTGTEADLLLGQQQVVRPMDGSLFGNMLRGVALAGQRDMTSVLDAGLLAGDTPCGGDRTPSRENVSAACAGGAWAQYSGSALSLDGADGMNSTAFGLLGGIDYAMGDAVHLGVQAGVGQVNGKDKGSGSGRAENVHGGVYAYANAGPLVLSALADWMHTDYHFQRATGIGPAMSTPGGQMLSAALQAAWPVQSGAWQFTPKLGVLFQRQTLAGFGETLDSVSPNAASFPVDGTRSRSISLQPYAAVDMKNSFTAGGVTYVPELSLGYRYNTHDPLTPTVQVVAQDGTPFVLPGSTQGRGFGTVNARITAQAGDSWSVYMGYQGLFGSRLRDNALNFGFNKRF